ncbi:hypothetical protein [Arthrobacter sp. 260]|uniref:hypothetical protein n=1 Tax=Arthrobacter sp. 260 TaxID=2735314 RepID=UPI001491367A|nr:hypothetical protein [Arthrobacter sp. 260]NOJ61428.1 hypothetical protein [Arthrobacter sp. 260]
MTRGDLEELRGLLAADVRLAADSGGKAPSVQRSVVGADKVARLLLSVQPQFTQIGITLERQEVNGQPGAVFRDETGRVLSVMVLSIVQGRVQSVNSVINPEKLGHLGQVADAWSIHAVYLARKRQR